MIGLRQQIESKIKEALQPVHLEVINESHRHNVPKGSETHFKVIVVTDAFTEKSLLERHQIINSLLEEAREKGLHACVLQTFTPEEWKKKGGKVADSPLCRGGE